MKTGLIALSALFMVFAAHADGVTQGEAIASSLAYDLGHGTVTCTASNHDRVELNVDKNGSLRMLAHYAAAISGDLDTADEGDGAECGGLTAKEDQKSDYVLEDDYNDCERGDWGFAIKLPDSALGPIQANKGEFTAAGWATVQGSKNDSAESFTCVVK